MIAIVGVAALTVFFLTRPNDDGGRVAAGDPAADRRPPCVACADTDQAIDAGQLYIPAINVNAKVMALATTMEPDPFLGGEVVSSFGVPPDLARTAWWSDGPRVGAPGMAVITGHTSGGSEFAVFNDLAKLTPGAAITVQSQDGQQRVQFRVSQVVTGISKSDRAALSRTLASHPASARLALITCEGPLADGVGESPDNTVIFAEIVPPAS